MFPTEAQSISKESATVQLFRLVGGEEQSYDLGLRSGGRGICLGAGSAQLRKDLGLKVGDMLRVAVLPSGRKVVVADGAAAGRYRYCCRVHLTISDIGSKGHFYVPFFLVLVEGLLRPHIAGQPEKRFKVQLDLRTVAAAAAKEDSDLRGAELYSSKITNRAPTWRVSKLGSWLKSQGAVPGDFVRLWVVRPAVAVEGSTGTQQQQGHQQQQQQEGKEGEEEQPPVIHFRHEMAAENGPDGTATTAAGAGGGAAAGDSAAGQPPPQQQQLLQGQQGQQGRHQGQGQRRRQLARQRQQQQKQDQHQQPPPVTYWMRLLESLRAQMRIRRAQPPSPAGTAAAAGAAAVAAGGGANTAAGANIAAATQADQDQQPAVLGVKQEPLPVREGPPAVHQWAAGGTGAAAAAAMTAAAAVGAAAVPATAAPLQPQTQGQQQQQPGASVPAAAVVALGAARAARAPAVARGGWRPVALDVACGVAAGGGQREVIDPAADSADEGEQQQQQQQQPTNQAGPSGAGMLPPPPPQPQQMPSSLLGPRTPLEPLPPPQQLQPHQQHPQPQPQQQEVQQQPQPQQQQAPRHLLPGASAGEVPAAAATIRHLHGCVPQGQHTPPSPPIELQVAGVKFLSGLGVHQHMENVKLGLVNLGRWGAPLPSEPLEPVGVEVRQDNRGRGLGLFTTQPICANTVICVMGGLMMAQEPDGVEFVERGCCSLPPTMGQQLRERVAGSRAPPDAEEQLLL
ncbi:hypothetical protein PLESTB_001456000 [Pleodorina starrii]|uniref:Uncharacterized protein n=1 Tax=Pleodorina starrii TaxID=330485 RepID=A0A9W6BVC8_9CHLO|nr:hypothetical protein PLESTM_002043100 [Pleodorina starrii]GLC59171.1 hypothetical protein PLESTB_001456000 [Pleodorina starrii]